MSAAALLAGVEIVTGPTVRECLAQRELNFEGKLLIFVVASSIKRCLGESIRQAVVDAAVTEVITCRQAALIFVLTPETLLVSIKIEVSFVSKRLVDAELRLAAFSAGSAPIIEVVGVNFVGFLKVVVAAGGVAISSQRKGSVSGVNGF